ncbi:hypothetical protein C8R43DRAFT_596263 [Mycena crocata]|nr:hypothetical protein C8R43DRAFT_596263 [Mycena crocata]
MRDPHSQPALWSSLLPTLEQTGQLRDLLRSNSLPRDSSHLRSMVALLPAELTRYEEKIQRFPDPSRRLVPERKALQDYLAECRSVFSPIRRLPPEILVEIIVRCAPMPELYSSSQRSSSWQTTLERAAQLHLLLPSQVCHSWHETIFSNPSLWTSIEADFTQILSHKQGDQLTRLVGLSLERSGNCPLDIAFHATGAYGGMGIRLLTHNSRRWQTADIFINQEQFSYLSGARGNLPLLRRLCLGGTRLRRLNVFETAPQLKQVGFWQLQERLVLLPWGQLSEVMFREAALFENARALGDSLTILRGLSKDCRFLIFNLELHRLPLPLRGPQPVTSDVSDVRLQLADTNSAEHARETLGAVLGTLTLPNLRHFSLASSILPAPLFYPWQQFDAFAMRSSCRQNLQALLIHDMIITETELVQCLSGLPSLRHLFIQDLPAASTNGEIHILITTSLFRRLTWSSGPECLVPRLAVLDFASLFMFDTYVWLDFVASRLEPGRDDLGPFRMEASYFTVDPPDLNPFVATRLVEMTEDHELICWLSRTEEG